MLGFRYNGFQCQYAERLFEPWSTGQSSRRCRGLPDGRVDQRPDRRPESEASRYGASHLKGEEARLYTDIR